MRKKLISAMLCMTMAVSVMLTGCGGDNQSAATDTKSEETQAAATAETKETAENEEVTLTLGIWPEDTLTDDIQVHEGYVAAMKGASSQCNMCTCILQICNGYFHAYGRVRQLSDHLRDLVHRASEADQGRSNSGYYG